MQDTDNDKRTSAGFAVVSCTRGVRLWGTARAHQAIKVGRRERNAHSSPLSCYVLRLNHLSPGSRESSMALRHNVLARDRVSHNGQLFPGLKDLPEAAAHNDHDQRPAEGKAETVKI